MEIKIVRKWFGLADFLDEQRFLEEQHRTGWKFVKFKGLTKYTFEKCEEEEYVYRLDYKEDDKDDEEYIQMFIDCGWEYIMKYQTWYYFRKPKSKEREEDNEILSDGESKIDMIKKVMYKSLIVVCVCFWFPCMFLLTNNFNQNKDLTYTIIMIIYALIMTFLLSVSTASIIKLNKLISEIDNPLKNKE